ncbi:MAG TPA: glycosyltransferase family 4 protein [Chloroflexota bacterium]|nr:glycosyltransferase family 4 protein [Chloroflexota bacterium]
MRVIHIVPTPFGDGGLFGGGERYPLELARALAGHVDTELITFGRRASADREPSGLLRRTLHATTWLGGHPAQPLAPALIRALLTARADVIHTHHMRALPSRIAALVACLKPGRIPLAVTDHGLQGSSWGGFLPRLFDLFLTVSAYSARELGAPASRTRVIYGGANPERYWPDLDEVRHGVLFVGRLTPHKGVDRLLAALPDGAHLRLVGSSGHDALPPERDYPALLRRLAADRDVDFVGTADDSDLPLLYRSAEVFVLPSVERTIYGRAVKVSELLGLAVLEAMASGTPVVASRVGGVSEIVQDGVTGFLVPPDDQSALHDRLALLLGDPALARRMGACAREVVLERFTWTYVAERCLAAYAAVAHRSSA